MPMRFIRITFVFAILFAFVVCIAAAQAAQATTEKEPTLEETLQWIQAKLKGYPLSTTFINPEMTSEWYQLSWEECRVDFTITRQIYNNGLIDDRTLKFSFLLKDLDSNSIIFENKTRLDNGWIEAFITIETSLKKEVISVQTDVRKTRNSDEVVGTKYGKLYHFRIYTTDELAERLAKAWQHAIKLCGGNTKKEIF
jgi:hypothetical protein